MKILFLDVDGVLNSRDFLMRVKSSAEHSSGLSDEHELDPAAVTLLNEIVAATGAAIVISSSWRHDHSSDEMQHLLNLRGFVGTVIDSTPWQRSELSLEPWEDAKRGHEIAAWLRKHPEVESFVIIDDDSDMAHLRHKLVKTTFDHGLTRSHVVDAIEMLRAPA